MNDKGQLGNGESGYYEKRNIPTPVSLPSDSANIIQISLGAFHTCAINNANDLLCWGRNDYGQVGDNTNEDKNTPTSISLSSADRVYATQIALGAGHTCAVDNSDNLYCWGLNSDGQLGDESNSGSLTPKEINICISGPCTQRLSLGRYHSCATDMSNDLFCWGWNYYGQLGDDTTDDKNTPTSISLGSESTSKVKELSGGVHTCAIDSLNKLFCWGYNNKGQLGDASTIDRHTPTEIDLGIASSHAVQVSLGGYHSCAIDSLNNLLCWGRNDEGQVGDATNVNKNSPVLIAPGTASSYVIEISLGYVHTCAIFNNGDLKCWGSNYFGQLGNGGNDNLNIPTLISLGANVTPTQIELGLYHTCAVDNLSVLRCWGHNNNGQLGDGSNTNRNTPTPVSLPSNAATIIQLSLGSDHTCAISDTNDLLCWGDNDKGRLGDGTTVSKNTPTSISLSGADGVYATQISLGWGHTCAFDNSGVLYCWGDNGIGQFGDGSNLDSWIPKAINI